MYGHQFHCLDIEDAVGERRAGGVVHVTGRSPTFYGAERMLDAAQGMDEALEILKAREAPSKAKPAKD
jgi:hypothetical protein